MSIPTSYQTTYDVEPERDRWVVYTGLEDTATGERWSEGDTTGHVFDTEAEAHAHVGRLRRRDRISLLRVERDRAIQAADDASESLRESVLAAIQHDGLSEYEAARLAGVTRMTIRSWLGK